MVLAAYAVRDQPKGAASTLVSLGFQPPLKYRFRLGQTIARPNRPQPGQRQ